jgi:hypothetical protein
MVARREGQVGLLFVSAAGSSGPAVGQGSPRHIPSLHTRPSLARSRRAHARSPPAVRIACTARWLSEKLLR